ncbi:MAG: 8-amino-7-oxononanoate synthase [Pirellulaceae bacterium]
MNRSLDWIADSLKALEQANLRRFRTIRQGAQQASIEFQADQTTAPLINFASNDYLGIAADQRLVSAVQEQILREGWGSGASPLITGRSQWHAELERRLAEFESSEDAILFSTGYAANVGAISALVGSGDTIFSDAKNHASIIDGCRLSRANVQVYRHNDVAHLAELLAAGQGGGRRLVVTDSLFSMDGDMAPLAEIAELAEQSNSMLLVDEAHATGVFGSNGTGLCEVHGIHSSNMIRIGTLSKAFGSCGGFASGSLALVEWLYNRARSYVFSTAMPAVTCVASLAALEIVQGEPQRRQRLVENATYLRERLQSDGWNTGHSASQIVPIFLGEPERAVALAAKLREAGCLVPAIRPPSVPEGESLLRISLTSEHTRSQLDQLIETLKAMRR